jgi:hypothetical protein
MPAGIGCYIVAASYTGRRRLPRTITNRYTLNIASDILYDFTLIKYNKFGYNESELKTVTIAYIIAAIK